MQTRTFDASAGFHLANAGTDRNLVYAEQICALERDRIRSRNEPEITRLQCLLETLMHEREHLRAILGEVVKSGVAMTAWPIWQTIMTVVFMASGLALALISLEPFDLTPELVWIFSIGIACVCAYGTAELIEHTRLKAIVLGLSIALFVSGLVGLLVLASVRGDIFVHHLQAITESDDPSGPATDNGLAFYRRTAPKMQLFLSCLSLALELAAGLALHAVRSRLHARRLDPSPESRRLETVEQEIGNAARHAKAYTGVIALLVVLGVGPMLKGEPIDLLVALDYSETSHATGYDGKAAYAENLEAATRVLKSLPAGSRIRVAGITDQSFARPLTFMTGVIPINPGRLREYDEIVAARQRLAANLRRATAATKPTYQTTDILGFLVWAGMAYEGTPQMRRVIVLYSDMRQCAGPIDIEHTRVVPVTTMLAAAERQHLVADLSGVEVYVYGVHAVDKDIAYWRSLREFWAAYFERCHASLRAFSMMRDGPNFASGSATSGGHL